MEAPPSYADICDLLQEASAADHLIETLSVIENPDFDLRRFITQLRDRFRERVRLRRSESLLFEKLDNQQKDARSRPTERAGAVHPVQDDVKTPDEKHPLDIAASSPLLGCL